MNSEIIQNIDVMSFMNPETDTYSVWVYDDDGGVKVYQSQMPNTVEIWFKFHKFSHLYWKLFEEESIETIEGSLFYNFNKMKLFMIRRLLCGTNIDGVEIRRGADGNLLEDSYRSVMSIHPRILRSIMDKVRIFPRQMGKSEECELEKQCSKLFGKGEGVSNPHPYITMYCNLVAFWDKFGMNYFDILKLPQDVFKSLKHIMSLENSYKSMQIDSMKSNSANAKKNPHGNNRVKF